MTTPLSQDQIRTINSYDQEQRLRYCVKEIVAQRQVWILTDEHGCVMLNTEEEECVPIGQIENLLKSGPRAIGKSAKRNRSR